MAAGPLILLALAANLVLGLGLSAFLLWKASHWRRDYLNADISDREYRRLIICVIGVNAITVAGISGFGCLYIIAMMKTVPDQISTVLITCAVFSLAGALVCIRFLHARFLRQPRLQRDAPHAADSPNAS
jgi:hypothetical protein